MPRKKNYSSWKEWDPFWYLNTYFSEVRQDTLETLKFINEELKSLNENSLEKILDFGAGPTVVIGLAVSKYSKIIHLADYLPVNLLEIRKWLNNHDAAFDWSHCIQAILEIEGNSINKKMINRVALNFRKKAKIFACDASKKWPLGKLHSNYSLVLSIFCADSATHSKATWRKYMQNILRLVAPKGRILIAALKNCSYYKIGEHTFPSANINEHDITKILIENGFDRKKIRLKVVNISDCKNEGFSEIIFASTSKE